MARRIKPIIDAILADNRLTGRDREFVESISDYYKRHNTLTSGRRRALGKIEETLNNAPDSLDSDIANHLSNIEARCIEAGDNWGANYIISIRNQLSVGRNLSERQRDTMAKLEARHSDDAKQEKKEWEDFYRLNLRNNAIIVAHYYLANPPYYGDLAKNILENTDYVPPKHVWEKFAENKYAKRVIAASNEEAKYSPGDTVQFNSNANIVKFTRSVSFQRNTIGLILKVDSKPITSAARGSRVYTVLFYGLTSPMFIEERWLKKAKK